MENEIPLIENEVRTLAYQKGYEAGLKDGRAKREKRGEMTNREWLNSLTDEELALWLCDDLNGRGLSQVKFRSTKSVDGLTDWMKEEHFDEGKVNFRIVEAGNCVCCGKHIDDKGLFLCEDCRRKEAENAL